MNFLFLQDSQNVNFLRSYISASLYGFWTSSSASERNMSVKKLEILYWIAYGFTWTSE